MSFPSNIIKKRNLSVTDREDIVINPKMGIAYQTDRDVSREYGDDYFDLLNKYENEIIGLVVNKKRADLVKEFCPNGTVLDIGAGAGSFIKTLENKAYGYDIMEKSIKWLKDRGLYLDINDGIPEDIGAITFWDSLEHIPEPTILLLRMHPGTLVFVSIPIIKDMLRLKSWKHFRPNEHYWYFTEKGFIDWMAKHGFALVDDVRDFEIKAGREDIYTFVFKKA